MSREGNFGNNSVGFSSAPSIAVDWVCIIVSEAGKGVIFSPTNPSRRQDNGPEMKNIKGRVKLGRIDNAKAWDLHVTVTRRGRSEHLGKETLPTCFWKHCWTKKSTQIICWVRSSWRRRTGGRWIVAECGSTVERLIIRMRSSNKGGGGWWSGCWERGENIFRRLGNDLCNLKWTEAEASIKEGVVTAVFRVGIKAELVDKGANAPNKYIKSWLAMVSLACIG